MNDWQILLFTAVLSGIAFFTGMMRGYRYGYHVGLVAGVTARIEKFEPEEEV